MPPTLPYFRLPPLPLHLRTAAVAAPTSSLQPWLESHPPPHLPCLLRGSCWLPCSCSTSRTEPNLLPCYRPLYLRTSAPLWHCSLTALSCPVAYDLRTPDSSLQLWPLFILPGDTAPRRPVNLECQMVWLRSRQADAKVLGPGSDVLAPRPAPKHGWEAVGPGIDVLPKPPYVSYMTLRLIHDPITRFTRSNRCHRAPQSLVATGHLAAGWRREVAAAAAERGMCASRDAWRCKLVHHSIDSAQIAFCTAGEHFAC